jgi:predicted O-methyltransferase YrrM
MSNPWSIDDAEALFLQRFVELNQVKTVLEFGPGRSTQVILDAGCEVWALEHDPKWLQIIRSQLGSAAGLKLLTSYQMAPELKISEVEGLRFDMAFIDGPPAAFYRKFGRINSIEFAAARTDVLLLHDALRDLERNSMEVMEEKGWQWRTLPSKRGLAVGVRSGRAVVRWPDEQTAAV